MSDELEQSVEQAPAYSDMELKALDMGWRPKDQFNGSEDDFIDAKEFVRRQPLFDKIAHQSRELKEVKSAVDALKTHYTAVRETEYKRALQALKQQRKDALSVGDGDRFEQIDDEIKLVETQVEQLKEVASPQVSNEPHPQFVHWVNANPWYNSTKYMREYADEVGRDLHARGMQPDAVLKEVEKAVRKEFPQKFSNPNKESAPNVESGARGQATKSGSVELTEQERSIMNTLVRSGTITKEKYLADLKAIKGIK
jgi:hypothetical protein